jgi:hypothetical protein
MTSERESQDMPANSEIHLKDLDFYVPGLTNYLHDIKRLSMDLQRVRPELLRVLCTLSQIDFFQVGDLGEASMVTRLETRTMILDEKTVNGFCSVLPDTTQRLKALILFCLHEICHCNQGIFFHGDYQRMKLADEYYMQLKMGEFDVTADSLAIICLTTYEVLIENQNVFSPNLYIQKLYINTNDIATKMLPIAVDPKRKDKIGRIVGYLLFAADAKLAYTKSINLRFDSIMFPVWGQNEKTTFITFFKTINPGVMIAGEIETVDFERIKDAIYNEKYELAQKLISDQYSCISVKKETLHSWPT